MRLRHLPVALTALAAIAAGPAEAKIQPVGPLDRATPVREYADWLLYSRWDGSHYRLTAQRDGQTLTLPVPASADPYNADVGPDSDGRPAAVVSVCEGSCDLYTIALEPGAELRAIRNANTGGHDEIAPSIWKGRLVFGRRYGSDQVLPYTKRIQAPRSQPSQRLADLPDERCGAIEPPDCRPIERVELPAMELWGRWVAQRWTYRPDGFGARQNEVRLTNVARTDTRQLARSSTGIGGQTYLGPSIAEGRVAFFRACQVDLGGCSRKDSGAIRYRISTEDYRLDGAVKGWTGWAWSGAADFHVPSAFDCGGGDPGAAPKEACGVYRRDALDWERASASRFR